MYHIIVKRERFHRILANKVINKAIICYIGLNEITAYIYTSKSRDILFYHTIKSHPPFKIPTGTTNHLYTRISKNLILLNPLQTNNKLNTHVNKFIKKT